MKHLRYLLMAALVAMPLVACDEDDDGDTPVTPVVVTGTVSGTVSIEGTGVAGVSVSLVGATSQTATTGSGGGYSFANVEGGSYGVAISGIPADATFATTSATTSITTQGQTVTVDFSGNYIRTSSIAGQIQVDGMGIAGVSVTATGPEGAKSAVTDNAGSYNFSGLRAGNYEIALSNIPAAYTFATATQTVTVGTGEAKIASFFGEEVVTVDPVTATVLIKSVTFPNGVAQNPAAIAGQMIVTLQIDPGNNSLNKVALLLDGVEVASQTLANTAAGQDGVRMLQEGTFEVDFSVATAALDADNAPIYLNGEKNLSASLGINNAEQATVETSYSLTFANADTFITTAEPDMAVISGGGVLYWGGAVNATALPVNYSGKTTASVTASFTNGGGAAVTRTDATAPYEFTWAATAGTDPLTGFQTPAAFTETFSLIRAQYDDNTLYTGGAINMATGVTIDNVGPPAPVAGYLLTDQATATTVECCDNNWVGPMYDFSDGMGAFADNANGVGGVEDTYHFGTASGTSAAARNASIAALAPVVMAGDAGLAPAVLNTDYRTVAVLTDDLGNATTVPLGVSVQNVLVTPNAGYDDMAPPAPTFLTGPADELIYNAASAASTAWTWSFAGDDRSGYGPFPMNGEVRHENPTTVTYVVADNAAASKADPINFAQGAFGATCAAGEPVASAPASLCTPHHANSPEGYYTFTAQLQDRAGNREAGFTRKMFIDRTAPTTGNAVGPTTLTGGAAVSFSAAVADNMEVGSTWFGIGYGAAPVAYIPFAPTSSQADGDWDATFTQAATASTTFNFVRVINTAVGVLSANTASAIRTLHTDAAGNPSAAASVNTFAAGAVTGMKAVGAGAETYVLAAPAATNLCDGVKGNTGTGACGTGGNSPAGSKSAVTLTYTATGTTGTFVNPFAAGKIHIYAVIDATPAILNDAATYYQIATLDGNAAAMTDDNVNRYYTWTYSLTTADIADLPSAAAPAGFPQGSAINFGALAVTSAGDGLHSAYDALVTRVAGN